MINVHENITMKFIILQMKKPDVYFSFTVQLQEMQGFRVIQEYTFLYLDILLGQGHCLCLKLTLYPHSSAWEVGDSEFLKMRSQNVYIPFLFVLMRTQLHVHVQLQGRLRGDLCQVVRTNGLAAAVPISRLLSLVEGMVQHYLVKTCAGFQF